MAQQASEAGKKKRLDALNAKRGISKSQSKEEKTEQKRLKKQSKAWYNNVIKNINDSAQRDVEELAADAQEQP